MKAAIGNHLKPDNQQALVSITEKLGIQPEQQDLQIVASMQNKNEITKAYTHCMQNCSLGKEFYCDNTKPNLIKMVDFLYVLWISEEWKLILADNFVYACY